MLIIVTGTSPVETDNLLFEPQSPTRYKPIPYLVSEIAPRGKRGKRPPRPPCKRLVKWWSFFLRKTWDNEPREPELAATVAESINEKSCNKNESRRSQLQTLTKGSSSLGWQVAGGRIFWWSLRRILPFFRRILFSSADFFHRLRWLAQCRQRATTGKSSVRSPMVQPCHY